jgi:hypothetical protein
MNKTDTPAKVASNAGLGHLPERESDEERYCYQALADLRRSYDAAAKPYIDRLVLIKSLRPTPSIVLTLDQAREFVQFGRA